MDVYGLKSSHELERAIKLANDYRAEFFKYPRGAMAWRNAPASEGLIVDLKNFEMAESFHFEFCLICKKNNYGLDNPIHKLHLKKDSLAYYFLCNHCRH